MHIHSQHLYTCNYTKSENKKMNTKAKMITLCASIKKNVNNQVKPKEITFLIGQFRHRSQKKAFVQPLF